MHVTVLYDGKCRKDMLLQINYNPKTFTMASLKATTLTILTTIKIMTARLIFIISKRYVPPVSTD